MTPEERFQENQKLVHFILQKKFPLVAFDEDVIQQAYMGLWKACIGFDEAKWYSFSTFAGTIIYHEVLKLYRARKKAIPEKMIFSFHEPVPETEGLDYFDVVEDVKEIGWTSYTEVAEAMELLTEKEKMCVLLVAEGYKGDDIAEMMGCSRSYVSYLLRRGRKRMKKYLYTKQAK